MADAAIDDVQGRIRAEYLRARTKHAPMQSAHEGYAVLQEEVDELWDDIKANRSAQTQHEEAVQVGAMAFAFILETG